MEFTLSVKSFHVPATPSTLAWPPSFPSVPTSRATRVTSAANEESWSTIVLTVFFSSRISPFTSTVIFFDMSPLATALVTSAMLRTWLVRLPAIRFTLSVRSFHVPATPLTSACPPSFPSVPTSRATRVTSEANERSWSTIVLSLRPIGPGQSDATKPVFDSSEGYAETSFAHGRRRPGSPSCHRARFAQPLCGPLPGHARELRQCCHNHAARTKSPQQSGRPPSCRPTHAANGRRRLSLRSHGTSSARQARPAYRLCGHQRGHRRHQRSPRPLLLHEALGPP